MYGLATDSVVRLEGARLFTRAWSMMLLLTLAIWGAAPRTAPAQPGDPASPAEAAAAPADKPDGEAVPLWQQELTPGEEDELFAAVEHVFTRDEFDRLKDIHKRIVAAYAQSDLPPEQRPLFCFAPPEPGSGYDAELIGKMQKAIWGEDYYDRFFRSPGGPSNRWSQTATNGANVGAFGDPVTLTYSFVADGTPTFDSGFGADESNLFAFFNSIYGNVATWQNLIADALEDWEAVSGVNYVLEPNDGGADLDTRTPPEPGVLGVRGDIRIFGRSIDGPGMIIAVNFFPDVGEMVIDTDDAGFYSDLSENSRALKNTVVHEAGHGLGMAHVCPTPFDNTPPNPPDFSIGMKIMEPFIREDFDGPQLDDIRGAHFRYGDSDQTNDTPATARDLGTLLVPMTDLVEGVSVDAPQGMDYYEFTPAAPAQVSIIVRPTGEPYLEGLQNADGSCTPGSTLTPGSIRNLNVEVLDKDGVQVAIANTQPVGTEEVASPTLSPAGAPYLVRVFAQDTINNVQTYELEIGLVDTDCNNNNIPDEEELSPETDCNGNGILDECEIESGLAQDCNENGIPDECDIASGVSQDCNGNGILDECEIELEPSLDQNNNGELDECEPDCNGNGVADFIDILEGDSLDCNNNMVPDECDVLLEEWTDLNADGILDQCRELQDCNNNGVSDPIEADNCDRIDLVVLVDTSSSMLDEAQQICDTINFAFSGLIEDDVEAQLVALSVADQPTSPSAFPCLEGSVQAMFPGPAPGRPEAIERNEDWGLAVATVAQNFEWTPGATRVIVVLSDEDPLRGNGCLPSDQAVINNAITFAVANDVTVYGVRGSIEGVEQPELKQCVGDLMNQLSEGTGGFSSQFNPQDLPVLFAAILERAAENCSEIDCDGNFVLDECELETTVAVLPRLTCLGGPTALNNDFCENAQQVCVGTISGQTTENTGTEGSASCEFMGSFSLHDVWFSYTAPESGLVRIHTRGSDFDTVLSVHTDCPGSAANEIACNDDIDLSAGDLDSEVSFQATGGETYFIRLAGFGGGFGRYRLTVNQNTVEPCVAGPDDVIITRDSNNNEILDSCEIERGELADCNLNGIPDESEINLGVACDANNNGIPDTCDLSVPGSDCNENGIPDDAELLDPFNDIDNDGVLDECEPIRADVVVIMDTSGSLDDEARALCLRAEALVEEVAATGIPLATTFLGIAETPTGDIATNPYFCLQSNVFDLLGPSVPGLPFAIFGDNESWGPAVAIVSDRFDWLPGFTRIVYVLADEDPNGGDGCDELDTLHIQNAIVQAIGDPTEPGWAPVVVNVVLAAPPDFRGQDTSCIEPLARQLAESTGGEVIFSNEPIQLPVLLRNSIVRTATAASDCNGDGRPDRPQIEAGELIDCNDNGVPDRCEIDQHPQLDIDRNGVLDACGDCQPLELARGSDHVLRLNEPFLTPAPQVLAGDTGDIKWTLVDAPENTKFDASTGRAGWTGFSDGSDLSEPVRINIRGNNGCSVDYVSYLLVPEGMTLDCSFERQADVDFRTAGASDWIARVLQGSGSFNPAPSAGNGLCMNVPAAGENLLGWQSPNQWIDLKDKTAYRVRITMSTTQTDPSKIPMWTFNYDNLTMPGAQLNFGGHAWFLSVDGSANGIGPAGGRSTFEVWMMPNAALTPQWRGTLEDGTTGAFEPEADDRNDIRIAIRALDFDSNAIGSELDEGTICIERIEVDSVLLDCLAPDGVVYDVPLGGGTHRFLNAKGAAAQFDGVGNAARIALAPNDARVSLKPGGANSPAARHPILWEDDTLYMVSLYVEAAEDAGGADPMDMIQVIADTRNSEMGVVHWSLRGNTGGTSQMHMAASPRKRSVAGGSQQYVGLFYSNNATASPLVTQARLRPSGDFFNTPNLFGGANGSDPLRVTRMKVTRMEVPE